MQGARAPRLGLVRRAMLTMNVTMGVVNAGHVPGSRKRLHGSIGCYSSAIFSGIGPGGQHGHRQHVGIFGEQ